MKHKSKSQRLYCDNWKDICVSAGEGRKKRAGNHSLAVVGSRAQWSSNLLKWAVNLVFCVLWSQPNNTHYIYDQPLANLLTNVGNNGLPNIIYKRTMSLFRQTWPYLWISSFFLFLLIFLIVLYMGNQVFFFQTHLFIILFSSPCITRQVDQSVYLAIIRILKIKFSECLTFSYT